MKRLIALAILSATASASHADMWAPSHSCQKPFKPFEFTDPWQLDSFNEDVRRYKECISDFVNEQNEAVGKHQDAAEDAIEEWNNFVNYELN